MQTDLKDLIRLVVPRPARNWLRSPSKSVGWLWNNAKFASGITAKLDMGEGWVVICHPHVLKAYRDFLIQPEPAAEFRNFLTHCSRSMVLYDVGAHFGIFSLTAARFGGRAVAVDPSPSAVHMAEVESSLNGFSAAVTVVCAAAGESSGTIEMLSSGVFSYFHFQQTARRHRRELTRVKMVTVDQLVQQYGAPTHLKIDVEGCEVAVLRGATATLDKYHPMLFIEIHNEMMAAEGRDPKCLLHELGRHGYATFAVDGTAIEAKAILDHPLIRVVARPTKLPEGIPA